jgi:hypothetical protein
VLSEEHLEIVVIAEEFERRSGVVLRLGQPLAVGTGVRGVLLFSTFVLVAPLTRPRSTLALGFERARGIIPHQASTSPDPEVVTVSIPNGVADPRHLALDAVVVEWPDVHAKLVFPRDPRRSARDRHPS